MAWFPKTPFGQHRLNGKGPTPSDEPDPESGARPESAAPVNKTTIASLDDLLALLNAESGVAPVPETASAGEALTLAPDDLGEAGDNPAQGK